jgi:hypothetical protein
MCLFEFHLIQNYIFIIEKRVTTTYCHLFKGLVELKHNTVHMIVAYYGSNPTHRERQSVGRHTKVDNIYFSF